VPVQGSRAVVSRLVKVPVDGVYQRVSALSPAVVGSVQPPW